MKAPAPARPRSGASGDTASGRAAVLLDACAAGAHAHQALLSRRGGAGDAAGFGAPDCDDARLGALVKTHERLLSVEPAEVSSWLRGGGTAESVAAAVHDLQSGPQPSHPGLPYDVAARFFAARAGDEEARLRAQGLAHLLQIALEVDRDAGLLQDTFRFLHSAGLLGAPADFGIPDDDDAMLGPARELAAQCVAAPFETDAVAWQLGLRRIQNWADRYRGKRGADACALEILHAPRVRALAPALCGLPAQRILVIGFSYTMDAHWSTDAPMNSMAAAVMARLNPGVRFFHLGHGGMTMRQARDKFLAAALGVGAQRVFLVAALPADADYSAAAEIAGALRDEGALSVCMFDRLHPDPGWWGNPDPDKLRDMAAGAGIEVIHVAGAMGVHPRRDEFVSLDGVHMRTPYHLWMAEEWLAWLARRG